MIIFVFIITSVLPFYISGQEDVQPVFSIDLISHNTSAARNMWSLLLENQLPKIGIDVGFHMSTIWSNIAPRTWSYPLIDFDYIPTYAEGGYDLLFYDHNWGFDWNPSGHYDTAGLIPHGNNIYQYTNPAYDLIIEQFITEPDAQQQKEYAKILQSMLYEDLPSIAIVYPKLLYGFKENLTGIDQHLLSTTQQRMERWNDSLDNIIKYGIPAELTEYNMFRQISYFDDLWMQPVYGSLFQRAQTTKVWEPVLTQNVTISSDSRNYTISIDPNARFSDGSNVLAEDIKYSYELHMSPLVGSSKYSTLTRCFSSNDSIEIVDTFTLNFNFTETYIYPYNILSLGIIDKSAVEPALLTYGFSILNEVPLIGNVSDVLVKSCGSFVLDFYDEENSVVHLTPNPYWSDLNSSGGVQPLLDEFQLAYIPGKDTAVMYLRTGELDIVDAHYYPVIADFIPTGCKGVLVTSSTCEMLAINLKHPVIGTGALTPVGTPAAAKYIRKAISHAIPRDVIVEILLEGLGNPGVTPCPYTSVCFDSTLKPYVYDIDRAKYYMEEAGFEMEYDDYYTIEGVKIYQQNNTSFIIYLSVFFTLLGTSALLLVMQKKLNQ